MDEVKRKLLGVTVLTRYNNKTYRVDDVLFDQNPLSTFQRGREEVTFKEYFQ